MSKIFNESVTVTRIFRTNLNKIYIECLVKDALDKHNVYDDRVHQLNPNAEVCVIFQVKKSTIPAFLNNGLRINKVSIGFGEFGYIGKIIEEVKVDDEIDVNVIVDEIGIRYSISPCSLGDPKTGIGNKVYKTKNERIRIIEKVAIGYQNIFVNPKKEEE